MTESFAERLTRALDLFVDRLLAFLPGLLAALLVLLLGVAVALAVRFLVARALRAARFDRLADGWGAGQLLGQADIRSSPSALAARLAYWVVLISITFAGLSALAVPLVDRLIAGFFVFLPRLVVAAAILAGGFLLAQFFSRAALIAAVNAGVPWPRQLALLLKVLIGVLAFAMALEHLSIARSIVLAAFVLTFGSVMLTLAIATGVVAVDVLRRLLDRGPAAGRSHDEVDHF